MPIDLRKADDRGQTRLGWLDSRHTFSFNTYKDPDFMGFRTLRVLNDDLVSGGGGFGMHGHANMEIISYVISGELKHKDSTGAEGSVRPGDVQMMSAGSGIQHSEFNGSESEPCHFLQIWIRPNKKNTEPVYNQAHFDQSRLANTFRLVASPDGADASLPIKQQAWLYVSRLEPGKTISHTLADSRGAWLHLATGSVDLNGHTLSKGDGARIENESEIRLNGVETADLILIEME